MDLVKINDITYILSDIIIKKAQVYSKGCRTGRELIKKKNIDECNYIFARFVNNKWVISNGKSCKVDKVFLSETFVQNIIELDNNKISQSIVLAPDIIYLSESEKFKDINNNILEIETRGKRIYNDIYFKVKDVSTAFNMLYLNDVILNKNSSYTELIDYKYFSINTKNELFLTYEGLLRVLFVSKNNNTNIFIKWALEKLFFIQYGTVEQKQKLTSDILGINVAVIKEVFNCSANTMPCVYLLTLGYVKDLRNVLNIDIKYSDDCIIAKYGMTKDLSRRLKEHTLHYKKITDTEIKVKQYSYIDPQYISTAECDIKEFIENLNLKFIYKNEEELIIIPLGYVKMIIDKYEHIGKKYSGHISELITRIKELEDYIEKLHLEHKLKINSLEHKLELQNEKYEHELLKKDYEILKLKTEINKN